MANHGQHQQGNSANQPGGGAQAIVELCDIRPGGLVFWSRHPFEVGAELQIRIRRDALPAAFDVATLGDWVTVRGFVVECPPVRRKDGSSCFRVSLLLDSALTRPARRQAAIPPGLPQLPTRFAGLARLGLN